MYDFFLFLKHYIIDLNFLEVTKVKPMMPTLSFETPIGPDWRYEIKYDGFRCILRWQENQEIELLSKYGNDLTNQFPEIIEYCQSIHDVIKPLLPLSLDGELVVLDNPYKGNFEHIQLRGRLKTKEKITTYSKEIPATFMAFDLLELHGVNYKEKSFTERKKQLEEIFSTVITDSPFLKMVTAFTEKDTVWKKVTASLGEGIIAKHKNSKWELGKRTKTWYKIKNWRVVSAFITAYQKDNGFFHVAIYNGKKDMVPIGLFKNGLEDEQKKALVETVRKNQTKEDATYVYVNPSLCVDIQCIELYKGQLREPYFKQFRFDIGPDDCTEEKLKLSLEPLPDTVTITNPKKLLWQDKAISKEDYLQFLRTMSSYSMPFLQNRLLTVIRFPDGVHKEAFYQKNCPDYAPDFVQTEKADSIDYIVCNNLETLIWLGNQAAIEFHVPFETIHTKTPTEIVFDLDPPSRNEFTLAVQAALLIKEVADGLQLTCYCKTSGNKGMQVYFPLPDNMYSYEDTRAFTAFIAEYLISQEPKWFTTERLKKNRGNKLYVDYIQHGERKTIIAPYSARGNEDALVATPLYWEEVTDTLSIEDFTIETVPTRVKEKGCPFASFFEAKKTQPYGPVLDFLKEKV